MFNQITNRSSSLPSAFPFSDWHAQVSAYSANMGQSSTRRIIDQDHLRGVSVGSWILFSHVKKLTQFVISQGQKVLGLSGSSISHRITHAGIVTDVNKDSSTVKVAEIAGFGKTVAENTYNLKHLDDGEEWLFASPESIANIQGLDESITSVSSRAAARYQELTGNQYNLMGLLELPFSSRTFTTNEKNYLINALLDYLSNNRAGQFDPPKNYFCSEFVLQKTQVATLLQLNGLQELIEAKIAAAEPDLPRSKLIQEISRTLETFGMWDEIRRLPLFHIPPNSATPGNLFDLASQHTSVIRVHNPSPEENQDSQDLAAQLEEIGVRQLDKYSNGEVLSWEDPEVRQFLTILETQLHYSKESLECFFKECPLSSNPAACIEICLSNTLTWEEKLKIFAYSQAIPKVLEIILKYPLIDDFIRHPTLEKLDRLQKFLSETNVIDEIFPSSGNYFLDSFTNSLIPDLNNPELWLKYVPLALAYNPPKISNLLQSEQLDLASFGFKTARKIFKGKHLSLLKSLAVALTEQYKKSSGNEKILTQFSFVQEAIARFEKDSGHSKETLECLLDKCLLHTHSARCAHACIEQTLSWKDSLLVYMYSQQIRRGIETILQSPQFLEFTRNVSPFAISKALQEINPDTWLKEMFPLSFTQPLNSMNNLFLRRMVGQVNDPHMLLKYLPLSIAYDPPSDMVKDFLKKENMGLWELASRMQFFLNCLKYIR